MPNNNDPNASLSDQATFQGEIRPKIDDIETHSLGDQATFAGLGSNDDYLDEDMEVIDPTARYKIERTLGKGGMGEVLLATDTRLNRKVAIKRILSESSSSSTAINRFLTEAKSIAALNHPNIVHIYDYGRSVDGPFLIMEYVDGGNLLDRCRNGAIPIEEAIHLACQLCEGLGRAHERGIIHRDIKPANILLTSDGVPKLTDFGLAKAETADAGMTMAGAVLGTLDFMPPEQRRDASQVDARSDLWSLAATLYQMLTGESPRVIDLDSVPKELRTPLARALKTKKDNRHQSASAFRDELQQCTQRKANKPNESINHDLGTGECPSCHIANESHRKFCRECGESLRCKCFTCQHEIPIWDKVCPECGAKQVELAQAVVSKFGKQREHAELLRSEYEYASALELAEKIATVSDPRISVHTEWAKDFIHSTKTEWEKETALAKDHYAEAKKHRQVFDYEAAIRSVEAIHEPLRTAEISTFLASLKIDQQETRAILSEFGKQREHAEHLRSQYQYASALELAEKIATVSDPRVSVHAEWAKDFIHSTKTEWEKQTALAKDHYAEAKKHRQVFDYEASIRAVEAINEPLRTDEISTFLASLKSDQQESLELLKIIKERVARRELDGLLPITERALLLRGNRNDLNVLFTQLQEREEKARTDRDNTFQTIDALFKQGKAKEALRLAVPHKGHGLDHHCQKLLEKLEHIVAAENEIVTMFKEAKADGVIDWEETAALLPKTIEYLKLNPNHVAIKKLYYDLVERLVKEPSAVLAKTATQIPASVANLVLPVLINSIGMKMKLLFPGKFTMGEESEAHKVILTKPFYLGVYEVTQEEYQRVMGVNPSAFVGLRNPVENVSWEDAVVFCRKLSELPEEKRASRVYRLPTEAEWEYACRAGSENMYCFGDDKSRLEEYAWFEDNSGDTTHPVGEKKPNAWGLYDMHGNVWEWCSDWYGMYPKTAVTDPVGPKVSSNRVNRGGGWGYGAADCRSADRFFSFPSERNDDVGFRIALSSTEIPE